MDAAECTAGKTSDSQDKVLLLLNNNDEGNGHLDNSEKKQPVELAGDLEVMNSDQEEEEEITIIEISDTEIKSEHEEEEDGEENLVDLDPSKLGVIVTEAELPDDLLGEPVNGVFRCKFCPKKFDNKPRLITHIERHISNGSIRKCRFCEFYSAMTSVLREHEYKHTNEKPYQCEMCDYCCRCSGDLIKHKMIHSENKRYKCNVCGHRTRTAANMRRHMERHDPNLPRNFPCPLCTFAFKRKSALKTHIQRRHTDCKPISCDMCSFRCKTMWELTSHKAKHSAERPYQCSWEGCNKSFKTKSDCNKHMKLHTGLKNYECNVCSKKFFTSTMLKTHAATHTDVRNFECGQCMKKFKTLRSLQSHVVTHQKVKPYQCEICYKTYATLFNLETHKHVHEGGRPYQCPICVHGSREIDHLLCHVGTEHLNHFTYFCGVCRKPFGRAFQLQLHIQRCHRTNMVDKEVMIYDPDYLDQDLQPQSYKFFNPSTFAKYMFHESMKDLEEGNIAGGTVKQEQGLPDNSGVADVLTESCNNSSAVEETIQLPPVVQLGRYGNVPILLARKNAGIELNCQKKGKKPQRWFMDVSQMTKEDAERHQEYLRKKDLGLLPQQRRKTKSGQKSKRGSRLGRASVKSAFSGSRTKSKSGKASKGPPKHKVSLSEVDDDSDEDEAYYLAQQLMLKLDRQVTGGVSKVKPERASTRSRKSAVHFKNLPDGTFSSSSNVAQAKSSGSFKKRKGSKTCEYLPEVSFPSCAGSKAAHRKQNKRVVQKTAKASQRKSLHNSRKQPAQCVKLKNQRKFSSTLQSTVSQKQQKKERVVDHHAVDTPSKFSLSNYTLARAAINTQCWLSAVHTRSAIMSAVKDCLCAVEKHLCSKVYDVRADCSPAKLCCSSADILASVDGSSVFSSKHSPNDSSKVSSAAVLSSSDGSCARGGGVPSTAEGAFEEPPKRLSVSYPSGCTFTAQSHNKGTLSDAVIGTIQFESELENHCKTQTTSQREDTETNSVVQPCYTEYQNSQSPLIVVNSSQQGLHNNVTVESGAGTSMSLSKCLHVLVNDVCINPCGPEYLSSLGVGKVSLDIHHLSPQPAVQHGKCKSGKTLKRITLKRTNQPVKCSTNKSKAEQKVSKPKTLLPSIAKVAKKKKVTGTASKDQTLSPLHEHKTAELKTCATGISGLLLATAVSKKQGKSPKKSTSKFNIKASIKKKTPQKVCQKTTPNVSRKHTANVPTKKKARLHCTPSMKPIKGVSKAKNSKKEESFKEKEATSEVGPVELGRMVPESVGAVTVCPDMQVIVKLERIDPELDTVVVSCGQGKRSQEDEFTTNSSVCVKKIEASNHLPVDDHVDIPPMTRKEIQLPGEDCRSIDHSPVTEDLQETRVITNTSSMEQSIYQPHLTSNKQQSQSIPLHDKAFSESSSDELKISGAGEVCVQSHGANPEKHSSVAVLEQLCTAGSEDNDPEKLVSRFEKHCSGDAVAEVEPESKQKTNIKKKPQQVIPCAGVAAVSCRERKRPGRPPKKKSLQEEQAQKPLVGVEFRTDSGLFTDSPGPTLRMKSRTPARKTQRKTKTVNQPAAGKKLSRRKSIAEITAAMSAEKLGSKADAKLWARIQKIHSALVNTKSKSAVKRTALASLTSAIVKKSESSAMKINRPSRKRRDMPASHDQTTRKKKRFLYVETDTGDMPDPPVKKRGRRPGPKIVLDRSQANLCFQSEDSQEGMIPQGVSTEAQEDGQSLLMVQDGVLHPSLCQGGVAVLSGQNEAQLSSSCLPEHTLPFPVVQSGVSVQPHFGEMYFQETELPTVYTSAHVDSADMLDSEPFLPQAECLPDVKPQVGELTLASEFNTSQVGETTDAESASSVNLPFAQSVPFISQLPSDPSRDARATLLAVLTSHLESSDGSSADTPIVSQSHPPVDQRALSSFLNRPLQIHKKKLKDHTFRIQTVPRKQAEKPDIDRRKSDRPRKLRLTEEQLKMAQDSCDSDEEVEDETIPLGLDSLYNADGNRDTAGSDIEYVSADYSSVDLASQRLSMENADLGMFPLDAATEKWLGDAVTELSATPNSEITYVHGQLKLNEESGNVFSTGMECPGVSNLLGDSDSTACPAVNNLLLPSQTKTEISGHPVLDHNQSTCIALKTEETCFDRHCTYDSIYTVGGPSTIQQEIKEKQSTSQMAGPLSHLPSDPHTLMIVSSNEGATINVENHTVQSSTSRAGGLHWNVEPQSPYLAMRQSLSESSPTHRLNVPIGPPVEGSPSLTISVRTCDGQQVLLDDFIENIDGDPAQNM